ncbi:sulfotransferase [uncultured Arenimonas sp.]|uniref:sulfotransferase n=1 Tax=uncultured Arenimonas sp. TaxID=546226 RepID=UPI0030DB3043
MKIQVPFLQLPVSFDARALADEIARVDESHWRPHPNKLPGNSALTLIATNGEPDNDDLVGNMRPTAALEQLPRVKEVLAALGATWGRSRLMRLSGQAEVTAHVDTNYYWRERMRVHVPVTTTPDVRFQVGDAETNMKAGECWIFDTWSRHRVINGNHSTRIHLVADTVGGAGLWDLISRGRPAGRSIPGWQAPPAPLPGTGKVHIDFESVNLPSVMTPWEIRDHFVFLLGEAVPHPRLPVVQQGLLDFARRWHALWSALGDAKSGWPRYRELLDATRADILARGAGEIGLRNEVGLMYMLDMYVFGVALGDQNTANQSLRKDVHGDAPALPGAAAPKATSRRSAAGRFERPVFIVSPPRSGSTLLFETLVKAPGVFSIGDESHSLIEGVPGLAPSQRGHDSNRLQAQDATPEVTAQLQQRFFDALRDRDGHAPGEAAVRLLEKTPKNALRIPFLRAVFPDARFIYLHRDPRQVLASMIEGWQSGRFVMYPNLPGWQGLPWSFLLVPGWRELSGRPLADIVTRQWETATRLLLDDLQALDGAHWTGVDHDRFLADPQGTVERLGAWAGWGWDKDLGGVLPLSRYTLTTPAPDKWRKHASDIEPRLAAIQATVDRAARAAG